MADAAASRRALLVVTRPQPQADAWVRDLAARGQPAVALPLMRIEALEADGPVLRSAWRTLAQHRLVMFVSPNAVLQFFAGRPAAAPWPADTRAAATGPGTEAALLQCGVPAGLIDAPAHDAERFDAETLWQQVLARRDWTGAQVLIVRGEDGRDWLAQRLCAAGAGVDLLAAYRRQPPCWSTAEVTLLRSLLAQAEATGRARPVWFFSSSQCIEHLAAHLVDDPERLRAARSLPVLATHPRIAETARRLGFAEVRPVSPDAAAVVASLD
ncbi:uroporphyrinogen-III synthase [Sphaerotilus hippei]|uniref:Uroporphyrinogen-III synthase n=1 Tax=Sphaerotilus hippei TaxID=744406 RepID=A0A318H0Z7_9BURK|nr:uroporphyrinogen-III synthase [Sphaerotilus hippei]PXW96618.1 uroporphyrinogen-III synthase [Sphaerotilus hippei]